MFIVGDNIDNGTKAGDVPSHGFKLVVGKDDGNAETADNIHSEYHTQVLDDCGVLEIVQFTS